MERKIQWRCGCYDEIELVYEKAENNDEIGALLSELEQMALTEAEESCGLLTLNGEQLTREMVLEMSEVNKEAVMYYLNDLTEFHSDGSGKIVAKFGTHIQSCLGCTMFSLLNRLEKLDGAYNIRFPQAVLEFQLPLGGRKGMMKWGVLIMLLYPWLSVHEVSYNAVADGLLESSN